MTLLTVIQNATKLLGMEVPDAVIGNTDRDMVEMSVIAQDAAEEISLAHDWQKFSRLSSDDDGAITGDGATTAWDLASDFDRMTFETQVWSSALTAPLTHISDRDEWLALDVTSSNPYPGVWSLYNGQMNIKDALASGVTAKYWYQSNEIFVATDGTTTKAAFTADTDNFRLDERLWRMCIQWMWREQKGYAYQEIFATYQTLLNRRIAKDGGARVRHIGRARVAGDVRIAYPQALSG